MMILLIISIELRYYYKLANDVLFDNGRIPLICWLDWSETNAIRHT